MIKFNEGEWFYIAGRGNVYATKMPETVEGSLLNKEVDIEGHEYTVIGVEKFLLPDETLYKDRQVGLLIRGPRK